MEILATVAITLLFVLLIPMIVIQILAIREMHRAQLMHEDLAKFIEQMGRVLQDASMVIETKKRNIGFVEGGDEE